MKTILLITGVLAVLMGLLWIGQGLGYIHWPASSSCSTSGRGHCVGEYWPSSGSC
ncbi:hypothetical protein [Sphingomonas sp.]|uniref:hypothetical protein n=1 Tax=Sphingomonas sp. TaxID=28214 RepID=UPI00286D3700|nr:hypothetical protein [Sphingomonas sp.]